MERILLRRSAKIVVVQPTTPAVLSVIAPLASYVEVRHYRGEERWNRKRLGLPVVEEFTWDVFGTDHKGRIVLPYGLVDRIYDALTAAGYDVCLQWATEEDEDNAKEREKTVYVQDWSRIEELVKNGFKPWYRQEECLRVIANNENGLIDCPPAWGKGTMIMLVAALMSTAKIAVVVDSCDVLKTRLYPELALNLPSVGIMGGGQKILGRRVMCYSADSLGHASGNEDIVLIDEVHDSAADGYASKLSRFKAARMFGFSASLNMRLDNKDLRVEALCGPIRFRIGYQEAVDNGIVAPIEVIWGDIVTDSNPCEDLKDVDKKRAGFWAHELRNKKIAFDASLYPEKLQKLITVETVEHALYLQQETGYEIVYSDRLMDPKDLRYFRDLGLLRSDFRPMTTERRAKLTKWFSSGELTAAIATPVWNVGVNFRSLRVLLRADGSASPIRDTQIPGRNSRFDLAGQKGVGIVHDYGDQFDEGYAARAKKRSRSYASHNWKQHRPGGGSRLKVLIERLMKGPTT